MKSTTAKTPAKTAIKKSASPQPKRASLTYDQKFTIASEKAFKVPDGNEDGCQMDDNFAVVLWVLVLNGNEVIHTTLCKRDAVRSLWMYRLDGEKVKLCKKVISLIEEGPPDYWVVGVNSEYLEHRYANPIAAAAVAEIRDGECRVFRVTECKIPRPA